MSLLELQRERNELITKARAIYDSAKVSGSMNDKESASFHELMNKADLVKLEIAEADLRLIPGERSRPDPQAGMGPQLNSGYYPTANRAVPGGRDFRSLFGPPTGANEFSSNEEFYRLVASGRSEPRLEARAFSVGDPSAGGFLCPDQVAETVLNGALEKEVVRPRATVWPMTTSVRRVPMWDDLDHTCLYGSMQAVWMGELGTNTPVTGKVRQIVLNAKKLAVYTQASNELVADGLNFNMQLEGAMVNSLGFTLDYAFLNGLGAGQPLGVLADPALIEVTPEVGQLADTILYENITQMWSRLAPACAANAVWLANPTTVPELLGMGLVLGTSASPVFAAGVAPGTLMSRPLILTEKLPVLGDKGDLLLCDLSQYFIGLRREIYLDKSNAPGWLTDSNSYRAILRVDGLGSWNGPLTPKKGVTLSWCVTLGARA